jgi:hypothetical protein
MSLIHLPVDRSTKAGSNGHKCIINHKPLRVQVPPEGTNELLQSALRNNRTLGDDETAQCYRIVRGGSLDLSELDEEISNVHNYLLDRMEQRDRLGRYVKDHNSILHPVRRLNDDLLDMIFMLAAEIDRDSPDFTHSLDTRRIPWVLGQVCTSWRRLAKNCMPLMWSYAALSISPVGPRDSKSLGYLMEHLLRRAGSLDLSVHLTVNPEYVSPHPGSWHPLLLRLFMACDRWKSFYLNVSVHSYTSIEWEMLDGNLPKLRTVTLYLHPHQGLHPLDFINAEDSVFMSAPQLTAAKVIGWDSDILPWGQLTKFFWSRNTYDGTELWHSALPEHLRAARNLEECEFDCVFASSNTPSSEEARVLLPKLRTLTLHSIIYPSDVTHNIAQISEPERLLDMFVVPALTSLTLTGPMFEETALIKCLEESQCNLTSLSITLSGRPETRTIRILQHLPKLLVLTLSEADNMTTEFIEQMTFKAESKGGSTRATICPILEELAICTSLGTRRLHQPPFPSTRLVNMIATRRDPAQRGLGRRLIETLSISGAEVAAQLYHGNSLATLEQEGLVVQFISPPRTRCPWRNSRELENHLLRLTN